MRSAPSLHRPAPRLLPVLVLIALVSSSCSLLMWGRAGGRGAETVDYGDAYDAQPIMADEPSVSVAAGGDHGCAATSTGITMCWGENGAGQLGNDSSIDAYSRSLLECADATDDCRDFWRTSWTNWASLAAGETHTCGITFEIPAFEPAGPAPAGELYCWGSNADGQLGHAPDPPTATVHQVGSATNWDTVTAGDAHTCAINEANELWCWGANNRGQLGTGTNTAAATPVQVGANLNWTAVAAGARHTCAITANGALYCWGRNTQSELGLGDTADRWPPTRVGTNNNWATVAAADNHTCATTTTNQLWCWGQNNNGQLGTGTTAYRTTPTHIAASTSWASVGVGDRHTCAITTSEQLWCWGRNFDGQLGVGDAAPRYAPTRVTNWAGWAAVDGGDNHTCALRSGGQLWCWGANASGQLAQGDTVASSTPERLDTGNQWQSASAGNTHACGIDLTNDAWCMGFIRDFPSPTVFQSELPARVPGDYQWATMLAGENMTCGVTLAGELYCWGINDNGQLGVGDTVDRLEPTRVGTATNWSSLGGIGATVEDGTGMCALTTAGQLYCWGNGALTPTAEGPTEIWATISPKRLCLITTDGRLFCRPDWVTPPEQVGTDTDWASVATESHTCAIKTNGELWCWGYNEFGQAGIEPTAATITIEEPTHVMTGHTWKQVATGPFNTVAVDTNGGLFQWGDDYFPLGVSSGITGIEEVSLTLYFAVAVQG